MRSRPDPSALRAARRGLLAALAAPALAHAGLLGLFRGRDADPSADDGDGPRGKGDVPLPAGARTEKDLAYGSDPQQKLDVYIPADAKKAPVVLMLHGGAWMIGDKAYRGVVNAKVARWLPKGVIVASANYRMDRQAPNVMLEADDAGRALAYVQQHAAGWGGDPARVLLMGHSAGAHLAALLAADPKIAERQGAKPWLGTVPLDSAAYDVVSIMEQHHYGFYDRVFGRDRQIWSDASPYHRLAGTPAPMLLVCSSRRADSCAQADRFAAKAGAAGARVSVLRVDLNHGGINTELGRGGDYTEKVEAFMRSLGVL